ncbi:MAG: HAD-IC family P-type ATPase [Coriobacteriia bacterium]|nr:HAD-IC family P-type ATPase [Coriobacteriia bacterium]
MAERIFGLTTQQVNERIFAGQVNTPPETRTRTIPRIIRDHIFTLFNLLNLILFLLVVSVGQIKNGLFFLIVIANTVIGVFQDVRAKLTIDQLAVIIQTHAKVIRNGHEEAIPQEEVVLGDVLVLTAGDQVCADGKVIESDDIEIDESLLTGESNAVIKAAGDKAYSGSFVVAGRGMVEVSAIGNDSYAQQIASDMRYEKKFNSQLMRIINFIIKMLAVVLIPLSLALFARTYLNTGDYTNSILAMAAAAVGMVPEGLMLLIGVAFAVGAYNLVKHRTLTQSMPSIETLARIDTLCLDKTGTITDGTLEVEEVIPLSDDVDDITEELRQFVGFMGTDNDTARALRDHFKSQNTWISTDKVAFSSSRKWGGCSFGEHGSFVLGAPNFVIPRMDDGLTEKVSHYASQGYRVLLFACTSETFNGLVLPAHLSARALIILTDKVRETAPDTFRYFEEQGVDIKVISGDDPQTVSTTAAHAGIEGASYYIDMSRVPHSASYAELMEHYTVFGRTTPEQKQKMILALQEDGKIVGMVGDGVNDTRALREADVGVAMASGAGAARDVADFVLVDSDFDSMVHVVKEGRRVVNNIEKVASLYIAKTIYIVTLTLIFIFLPFEYPFVPIQLTLINFFMIGVPSFFLTFTPDYSKMQDWFAHRLIKDAVPAAILVIINVVALQLIGSFVNLSFEQLSTLSILLTGIVSMFLLRRVSEPFTKSRIAMDVALVVGFFLAFIIAREFFELVNVFDRLALIWVPYAIGSYYLYEELTKVTLFLEKQWIAIRGKTMRTPARTRSGLF